MVLITEVKTDIPVKERVQLAGKVIAEKFLRIPVGNRFINCPFFMNNDPDWKDTPYYFSVPRGGKMTPEEVTEKLSGAVRDSEFDADNSSLKNLRMFMRKNGIGVDCSGLTYQVLKYIYENSGGSIFEEKVIGAQSNFRGVTKTNSDSLTSLKNSNLVAGIEDIKPGDIIRGHGGHHSIVIFGCERNLLRCIHSSDGTSALGVSAFEINLIDLKHDIFHQDWSEVNNRGIKYNKRLLSKFKDGDGVWRLRIMQELYDIDNLPGTSGA